MIDLLSGGPGSHAVTRPVYELIFGYFANFENCYSLRRIWFLSGARWEFGSIFS